MMVMIRYTGRLQKRFSFKFTPKFALGSLGMR